MSTNKYSNFVRPSSSDTGIFVLHPKLCGNEAKKLYLEEVKDIGDPEPVSHGDIQNCDHSDNSFTNYPQGNGRLITESDERKFTDKDLFVAAQNNDVSTLKTILEMSPDKINTLDNYGWSLLMIACQANSIDAVKMLLKRDIDTSIRDKADNSATSLVIKSKNLILADLLLAHKRRTKKVEESHNNKEERQKRARLKEQYVCDICNKTYPDKQEHLSSTIHNINASKGKKIPASYAIPNTNKGYQLMIKGGWDRESGLGPDGTGRRNPIRAIQKKDRKGLGLEKKKQIDKQKIEPLILTSKRLRERAEIEKRKEALFRREFY